MQQPCSNSYILFWNNLLLYFPWLQNTLFNLLCWQCKLRYIISNRFDNIATWFCLMIEIWIRSGDFHPQLISEQLDTHATPDNSTYLLHPLPSSFEFSACPPSRQIFCFHRHLHSAANTCDAFQSISSSAPEIPHSYIFASSGAGRSEKCIQNNCSSLAA